MKKNSIIDHAIYHFPDLITKKIEFNVKYIIASVIGFAMFAIAYNVPFITNHTWWFAIFTTAGWCAVATVITVIFYLLIGDCRRLYYKPTGQLLERCEVYYEQHDLGYISNHISKGDFDGLLSLTRSYLPNYALVMYRSHDNGILLAQLVDNNGLKPRPITDIKIFEKGQCNFPDSAESLSSVFYR